jgi:hypothetical protein
MYYLYICGVTFIFLLNQFNFMRTKSLLTLLFASICLSLSAQQASKSTRKVPTSLHQQYQTKPAKLSGFESPTSPVETAIPTSVSMLRTSGKDEHGGNSSYDFQTNGCEQARVHVWPNGEITMAWTTSPLSEPESTTFPNRGTGYNSRSEWQAGTITENRIETVRTGFSNYVVTADGTEHIFAHTGTTGNYRIRHSRRAAGATTWVFSDLPTSAPNGELWCKAAADGNSIHLIAVTTPTGTFGGSIYLGMDGHVLYWRSSNSGQSWDIVDQVIPGLDKDHFIGNGGDSYTITAKDCTVAVGIFESWADTKIFKSTDCGNTWNTLVVNDFPYDTLRVDVPYPPYDPPLPGAPNNDPYAIQTSDEKGSLVIDPAGNVHCFYGFMWVRDSIYDDANSNYYPSTNGIVYWRETEPDVASIITGSLDINGNDTLDISNENITGVAYNTSGLASMPSAAADDNGGIYVVYSALVENVEDQAGLTYRHIYAMKSPDLGDTWFDPVDIQYWQLTDGDSVVANLTEAVYPSCVKNNPDGLHFQYQRDFLTGSGVRITGTQDDQYGEMIYFGSPLFVDTKTPEKALRFGIVPNPSSTSAYVQLELEQAADTQIQLFDINGSLVRSMQMGTLSAGAQQIQVRTADLPNGAYFVRVQSAQQMGTAKLIVLKQ